MNVTGLIVIILINSLVNIVTPGPHVKRRLSPDQDRPCSLADHVSEAQCVQTDYRLICRHGFSNEWTKATNRREITHLRVLEWPGECFNIGRLQDRFPELKILEFINCTSLTIFKGRFDETSKIEKLEIHGLSSLWEAPADMVFLMKELKVLDLRGNVLRHMKARLIRGPPLLERVYLSDNKWDCSDGGLDWLAMERENGTAKRKIVDYYKLMCHQQLYRGKPLHKVMDIIRISSIRSMIQNPHYQKLADLYLDNNSISAVKELEGSEWFTTFRVLSLRGNLLKQIPVYAFDKAMQGNNNIMHVFLGQNPWRCDCHFIPRFQGLLLKYKRVIGDLSEVRCSRSEDKTISLAQISTMPLGNVCRSGVEMPISTINIINLTLTVLILVVLGRFLYDWHSFKTTGKLPWLSSILP